MPLLNDLPEFLVVGAYTQKLGHVLSKACPHTHGITTFRLVDGQYQVCHRVQGVNCTYCVATVNRTTPQYVYAVSENYETNESGNLVSAYRFEDGVLTLINSVESGGCGACHLSLSPNERFLAVANYMGGSVSLFGVNEDGSLGARVSHSQHEGHGSANPERQSDGPHAHMAAIDPTGHWCLVPDLGLDKVFVYAMFRPDIGDRLIQEMMIYVYTQHQKGVDVNLLDALYDNHGGAGELSVPNASSVEQLVSDARVIAAWKSACKEVGVLPRIRNSDGAEQLDEVYAIEAPQVGTLVQHEALALPAGSGPRHVAFHPNGTCVFVLNELLSTLCVCDWHEASGCLGPIRQNVPLVPGASVGIDGQTFAAAIRVSPDGRFVYCSNRGHDSISAFSIGHDGCVTRHCGLFSSATAADASQLAASWPPSHTPRDFTLCGSRGEWLVVGNQDADIVNVFARDIETGALSPTSISFSAPAPVCILPMTSQ